MIELKTGELFAGAGGLSLGFLLADHPRVCFRPVFAIDIDPDSVNSYQTNMAWLAEHAPSILPKVPRVFARDIERVKTKALLRLCKLQQGDLDLLLGGPPCQGYSSSNRQSKKQHKDEQNRLVKVFLDKLEEFRPKMFLLENVQGVGWTEPTEDMQPLVTQEPLLQDVEPLPTSVQAYMIQKARRLGYRVWHGVLDAVDFGVPQHRMRFFLYGICDDLVPDDRVADLALLLRQRMVTDRVSVSTAIADLPPLENGQAWMDGEYCPADNVYVRQMRRFMENGDLFDHRATNHQAYVIERYRNIPQGGNWEDIRHLMTNYATIDNTHSNIYRRLVGATPAHTISHYRKAMTIHPMQHRGLSFREACRLQSFPDWFRFNGAIDDRQQQLANAVPPLMASAAAWAIAENWCRRIAPQMSLGVPVRHVRVYDMDAPATGGYARRAKVYEIGALAATNA